MGERVKSDGFFECNVESVRLTVGRPRGFFVVLGMFSRFSLVRAILSRLHEICDECEEYRGI